MNQRTSHCEDFPSVMDESGDLFNSFISMDPVGSLPIWQECGLYHTTRFCCVLVALGFLLPARSFTSKGTSSAERRVDKPQTFGFDFWGAAIGAFAPMGWGLFGEDRIFPYFNKPGDSASSWGSVKLADKGVDGPLSGNMGSSFIFNIGSSSVTAFRGEIVTLGVSVLGDEAKGW